MIVELADQQIYQGNLILVNGNNPCRQQVSASNLITVGTQKMEKHAGNILKEIFSKIGVGEEIIPISGFRPTEEQARIYESTREARGKTFADSYVALPGCSEHETGLAIDLAQKKENIDFVCPDFPFSGMCQRFREKAPAFGFVQRYPMDKEAITGILHEPWHFRYVGFPHALIMTAKELVLEEYLQWIKNYRDHPFCYQVGSYKILIWYVDDRRVVLNKGQPVQISGNNVDGYIITQWQ